MKLSWDCLRLVLAIADGNGLSGAAKKLNIHHSTVLRQLDALEHQAGVVLFDRKSTGYTPTGEGLALANKARLISIDVNEAYLQLEGEDLRISGTIRIASSDFLTQLFLVKALYLLKQRYPNITPEIVVSSKFASLSKRDADVALRAVAKTPKKLKGKHLTSLSYAVYAHRSIAEESSCLSELDWITDDETLTHSELHHWLHQIVSKPRISLRANSTMIKLNAIKQCLGVGLLPKLLGELEPDLICLYSEPLWTLDLWFLSHNDLYNMQRIQALEATLIDVI